jgi:diguanylate cyclase (GGDEF)-like protein
MQSTIDYKNQNQTLEKYLQKLQQEMEAERDAMKDLKSESNREVLRLESFIVAVSDMAMQINSTLDISDLLRVILMQTKELLGSTKCAIFNVEKNDRLAYIDSVGYDRKIIENLNLIADEEYGQVGFSAKRSEFVSRKIVYQDPSKRYLLEKDRFETYACQPILRDFKTAAVVCVGDISESITEMQAMRILSTLANFGGVALTNLTLVEKIREQSRRDSLTWLYNHQYFQDRLEALLAAAMKNKEPLGLIIMDLDHFKSFNDTYGHMAGDFILKKTAELLNSETSSYDVVSRYGGEEFAIVLPEKDQNAAYEIGERIRKRFIDSKFDFEGKSLIVTTSIGVSTFDPSKDKGIEVDRKLLIKYADKALYKAKEEGRNKVVLYGS